MLDCRGGISGRGTCLSEITEGCDCDMFGELTRAKDECEEVSEDIAGEVHRR